MKRLIAAIIAVSYLCLSTGFTLHVHYCMGKRIGASLLEGGDTHKCSHCGMKKKSSKKGCCHDEHKIVKAKSDAAFAKAIFQYSPAPVAFLPTHYAVADELTTAFAPQQKGTLGRPHGPPIATALRLHVRNCVFLI